MGGVELEGDSIVTVDAPGAVKDSRDGSLGADVLSRFGSVKIDFKKETLTLGAEEEEGPRFKKGQGPVPIPAALLARKPKLTVPMNVQSRAIRRAADGQGEGGFDQGPALADRHRVHLLGHRPRRRRTRPPGAHRRGAPDRDLLLGRHRAGIPGPEPDGLLGEADAADLDSFDGSVGREAGILGAYSLWQYGSAVFDWPGGKLLLGVG